MWTRSHVKLCSICDENAISSFITRRWKEAGMPASVPQLVALVILAMLPMNCRRREATLEEIFSDPVVRAMMEADGVNPHELATMLRQVTQRLRTARRGDESPEDDRGNLPG
jgi:hypothetical protein